MRRTVEQVEEVLRQEVASGALGERLPRQVDLASRFGVSRGTVAKALARLEDDGFVRSSKKGGTRVCPGAGFQRRVGVVFPHRAENSVWSPYWHHLHRLVTRTPCRGGLELEVYHAANGDQTHPDYRRLEQDVLRCRVGGLIFVSMPVFLIGLPPLTRPGLPRVAVMDAEIFQGGTQAVFFDRQGLVRKAVQWLDLQGCSRIAVLNVLQGGMNLAEEDLMRSLLRRHGMRTHRRWWHRLALDPVEGASNLVELLFSEHQTERPDALFIADDTIAPKVLQAVSLLPASIRRSLHLLAHANFPVEPGTHADVHHVGFDSDTLLERLLANVRAQMEHRETVRQEKIPAVLDP